MGMHLISIIVSTSSGFSVSSQTPLTYYRYLVTLGDCNVIAMHSKCVRVCMILILYPLVWGLPCYHNLSTMHCWLWNTWWCPGTMKVMWACCGWFVVHIRSTLQVRMSLCVINGISGSWHCVIDFCAHDNNDTTTPSVCTRGNKCSRVKNGKSNMDLWNYIHCVIDL